MIAVIGSGPAGVAAAVALAERGVHVHLFDAGLELERERRAAVDRLATLPRKDWPADALAEVRSQPEVGVGGVAEKLTYGSDFPYREVERWQPFENHGSDTKPTFARGGFSTVWGSCALPYLERDLADWPVSQADLAPHYRAVARFAPLSAREDDLAEELPLFCDDPRPLRSSRQAERLLADLGRHRDRLRAKGLRFGSSRIAVRAEANERGPGCCYCAGCMYGCPYRLIYDASSTLDRLVADGSVTYEPGVVVDRLEETSGGVTLVMRSLADGTPRRENADRVYVGCGVLGTTRLLLASLDAWDTPATIRDSQYFLLPWLRAAGTPKPREEELHTLCQAFLEIDDPAIDPHNIHLQVYTYNDLYAQLFDSLLGPLAKPLSPLVDALLARTLLFQGYLHSDSSPSIEARLVRGADDTPTLSLREQRNPVTRRALRRLVTRLFALAPQLRALPAFPALSITPAGRGFHTGGSFPMHGERTAHGGFASDVLGRPDGFERVHVVDSTTFPTIPSTTITWTVMANAHRIASADV